MATRFIPFGNWRPGTEEIDTGNLETCENLFPMWGGYSMIRKLADFSPDSANPGGQFIGQYGHLLTDERTEEGLRPDSDIDAGNWLAYLPEDDDGNTDTLYDKVNELVGSEAEYIYIGGSPSAETCELGLDDPENTPDGTSTDYYIKCLYEITGSTGAWTLDIELLQGSAALSTPAILALSGSSDQTLTTGTLQLSTAQRDAITDFTDLSFEIDATVPGAIVDMLPQETEAGSGWQDENGSNASDDLVASIDEDPDSPNDLDYIRSGKLRNPGDSSSIRVRVQDAGGTDPTPGADWTIRWRARVTESGEGGTPALPCSVALYEGNSLIQQFSARTLGTSYTDYSETVTAANNQSITNFDDLWIEIVAERSDVNNGEVQRARVSVAMCEGASDAEARVHWLLFAIPVDENILYSSRPQMYFARDSKLWQLKDDWRNFDEVTNVSGTYGVDPLTVWSFCSFGNSVVGTKLADTPQIKGATDTDFSDLVTSPAVKAKFCMTVGPHLVLGNTEYAGSPVGEADEIWWSGYNDPTTFSDSADPATQANRLRLVHTPGDITGMVGGDYGIIFKPTSIYRIDYVGADLVYNVRVISRGIGTHYPFSIIQFGTDIYFLSTSGFAVLRNGQSVELIDKDVNRAFMDHSFSDISLNSDQGDVAYWEELAIVGAADMVNGLLIWLYRKKGNTKTNYKNACLVYSVFDGRWGSTLFGTDAAADVSTVVTVPHFNQNDLLHRSVIFTRNTGTDAYASWLESDEFYDATIKTHRFSAGWLLGDGEYNEVLITGIRPIIRAKRRNVPPSSQITLTTFNSPYQRASQGTTATETLVNANRDGWVPFNESGEFFTVEMQINGVVDDQFVLAGFQVRYAPVGETESD